ncbi:hypothetical protein KY389_09795 [Paracoccus bogoriensis]|uniref:hypothetical protein n=1 Tax=Paracoccus bogoriensis TaxID=242065 RepID=UPI001CA4F920|nr:hypothetical protein [Paracoccus bogoriensis]MBW7056984.1 hypothetical protein [Paracoccus bogoriensis]
MESQDETQTRGLSETRKKLIRDYLQKIEADNARQRDERNARRWKAERDPEEYERQKAKQRHQYADAQGGSVRSYSKIEATTRTEHAEKAKARDAARQKARYHAMTPAERQAKSDQIADKRFVERRREKGIPEDLIQAALAVRIREREAERAAKAQQETDEAAMRALATYGIMGGS